MPKIQTYDFCCILAISISVLFWDTKDYFSNLRFIIITIPFIYFYFKKDFFCEIKENWKIIFIPIFFILGHYFFSMLYTNFSLNFSSIFKLLVLSLISISVFLSLKSFKKNFSFFINFSVIILFIFLFFDILANLLNDKFLSALSINRLENCYHGYFTQMSSIFREESHFAMNISPLLLTSIFLYLEGENKSNLAFIISVLIIFFAILFSLSLTFIISTILFLTLSIFLAKKKTTRITIFFIIILLPTVFIFNPKCADKLINISSGVFKNLGITFVDRFIVKIQNRNQERITTDPQVIEKIDSIKTGLSGGVYINSIKIAKNSASNYPLGVGFDNYNYAFNSFIEKTSRETGELEEIIRDLKLLNHNDGSNNFAKISAEFGILSVFFYIILAKFFLNKQIEPSMKIFVISTLLLIRGAGYFNGGFLVLYFFALYFPKLNEKK